MEAEKKEVKERRKDRKKNCFTGSSFECDFFFSLTHTESENWLKVFKGITQSLQRKKSRF